MRRFLITGWLLLSLTSMWAQRTITIYNIDTKVPLRGVKVWVDSRLVDSTDYQGHCSVPQQFTSLFASKPGFLPATVPFAQVKDAVGLLPAGKNLGEVTIWGEDKSRKLNQNVHKWIQIDQEEWALQHPQGADLLGLAVWAVDKLVKQFHHKKAPKVDNEDPVMKAYRKTQEEMKRKKAEQERWQAELKARKEQENKGKEVKSKEVKK